MAKEEKEKLLEQGYKTIGMIGKEIGKNYLRSCDLPKRLLLNGIKSNGILYPPETVKNIIDYVNLPQVEKTKLTDMERYGVEHHTKSNKIKEKQEKTNMERYGVKSTSQIKEVKEKQLSTLMLHYGVTIPSKDKNIAKKITNTFLQNNIESKGAIEERCKLYHDDFVVCSDYHGEKKDVIIYCKTCGNLFFRKPIFLERSCPYCTEVISNKDWFIKKSKLIHKNKYDYSEVKYLNNKEKVKIFCKKCQKYFWQRPNDHLNGHGHDCITSKLEEEFNDLLLKNNINFKREVSFDDCRGKCRKLPFDFYLTDLYLLVEIQGEQHYLNKWGNLEKRKRLDKIKRDYAMKFHNFLEIPYWQNLEKIVKHLKKDC